MKVCPACAEAIQDAAVKCRFCGSDVRDKELQWRGANIRITGIVLHLLPLLFLVVPAVVLEVMNTRFIEAYAAQLTLAAPALAGSGILVWLDARWARLLGSASLGDTRPTSLNRDLMERSFSAAPVSTAGGSPAAWGAAVLFAWPIALPLYSFWRRRQGIRSFPMVMSCAVAVVTAVHGYVFWTSMSQDLAQHWKDMDQRNVMDLFGSLKGGKVSLSLSLADEGLLLTAPEGAATRRVSDAQFSKALQSQQGDLFNILVFAGEFLKSHSGTADQRLTYSDHTDVDLGSCRFRFLLKPQGAKLGSIKCDQLPNTGTNAATRVVNYSRQVTNPPSVETFQGQVNHGPPQVARVAMAHSHEVNTPPQIQPPGGELQVMCGTPQWKPFRRLIEDFCLRHPSADCVNAVEISKSCRGGSGDVGAMSVPANGADFNFPLEGEEGIALEVYFTKKVDSWMVRDVKTVGE